MKQLLEGVRVIFLLMRARVVTTADTVLDVTFIY